MGIISLHYSPYFVPFLSRSNTALVRERLWVVSVSFRLFHVPYLVFASDSVCYLSPSANGSGALPGAMRGIGVPRNHVPL